MSAFFTLVSTSLVDLTPNALLAMFQADSTLLVSLRAGGYAVIYHTDMSKETVRVANPNKLMAFCAKNAIASEWLVAGKTNPIITH